MKRLLLFCAVIGFAALPSSAQTADDLFFYGRRSPAVGARMAGMGGAAVAGMADWSGTYANPAGLAYLQAQQVTVSAHGYVQGTRSYGFRAHNNAEGASIGIASFATPIPTARGSLVVGGGYHETSVFTRGSEDDRGRLGVFESRESGVQGELSAAGAMAVSPRVMVGISANAPVGRYEFENGFSDGGPADDSSFDAEFVGANVRGGVSVQATPGLRIGATIESPTFLRVTETGNGFGENEFEMITPWRIAAGFMISSPRSILSADVEFVDWSQAEFLTDDPYYDDENSFARRYFNPVLNVRFGGEVLLGPFALRAGTAIQPDPRFEVFEDDTARKHYSAGVGIRVARNARVDLAFIHTELADGPRGQVFDEDGYYLWEAYRSRRNAIQIGVDMRF